jgi:uncharacterized protein (DUF983 family)
MLKKGTKAHSIFLVKCPKCQDEYLFEERAFSFRKSFQMRKACPQCQQDFEPEPGFYYGAMFISYIFMGWFCIGFVALLHWVLDFSLEFSFIALILVVAFFFVYIFRLARSIWLSLNVKYDPSKSRK